MLNKTLTKECFNGLILPYDCDGTNADALFITEYDGISIANISSVVDSKYVSLKKAVESKTLIAARNVWAKTKAFLTNSKGITYETCAKHYNIGIFNNTVVSNNANDGLIIAKPVSSKFAAIKVNTITVKSPLNGTYTVFIKSIGGAILWQQNISLQPNLETILTVDVLFYENAIISTTIPQGYQTTSNSATNHCEGVYVKDVCNDSCCDLLAKYLNAGVQTYIGSTLIACVSLECSEDLMLCALKEDLSYAILYQTVHHLLAEATNTNRVNAFVLNGMEWIEENKLISLNLANAEIENNAAQMVSKLTADKCCIGCTGTGGFRKVTVLP